MGFIEYNVIGAREPQGCACRLALINWKNGTVFSFKQTVKSSYQNVLLNTEDSLENPSEILISGYHGIYFETHDGEKCIIWDQGDYILDVSGYGIGKYELIGIAGSVQKVE